MNPLLKYAILCVAWIPVLLAADYDGDRTAHRALVVLAVILWSFVTDLTRAIDKEFKRQRDDR